MVFCSNCGAVVNNNSSYCEICGQVVDPEKQDNMSSVSPRPAAKEESVSLCNALASKYESYEKIKEEIRDLEFSIKKMEVTSHPPRYTFFRFYWPFFIVAAAACFFSALFVGILTINENSEVSYFFTRVAGYLSIPVVLVIGIIVAKARQNKANDKLAQNEMSMTSQANNMRVKINDLKKQQSQISDELQEYKDLIPVNMRNKNSMIKIKRALELSQAETFEQAIELVKNPVRG